MAASNLNLNYTTTGPIYLRGGSPKARVLFLEKEKRTKKAGQYFYSTCDEILKNDKSGSPREREKP